ncbi:MAG: phosphatidate cytidylyltransferase [Bacilli bacterium]|nr:phosphatidate cytidylyltransferase [Bacilli bacterium]MDD3305010.1 phosphatidate cytidylyltransferase [Bacilli bacterium]MDD4053659.1 phosphatidate cytidylyltransferase [Bacilli bacterium]MDD4411158.1 phosphatidate cytidylyltransferase [Bacilli bacterium]
MKQRTITALLILLICIPILVIGGTLFNLFVVLISILGLKEMIDVRDHKSQLPIVPKLIALGTITYLVVNISPNMGAIYLLDYRTIAFVMLLLLLPIIVYHDSRVYNITDAFFLIGSVFLLGISLNLLIMLRTENVMIVIYLFVITVMTDTWALIAGKLVGKYKLLESISPKKTWEGLIAGTIFGVLFGAVFYYITIDNNINVLTLILGTTLLSLIGQLGDLVFSSIKRLYNKKDFSNLMPGHGGILDRLDSFLFVALGYLFLFL